MNEAVRRPTSNSEAAGRKTLVQELASLTAIVLAPVDDQTTMLMRELQRFRMRVQQVWPMPATVPGDADVIFSEYSPDLARRLPWIPGDARSSLVVIVPATEPIQAEPLSHATPNAVLSRPFTPNAVLSSLIIARSQFSYERRLRTKIEKLDENLRSMRTVERAKAILMATRQMQESEAYSFIRRQAMDRRVSASAVAAAIVDSFELIGYEPQR